MKILVVDDAPDVIESVRLGFTLQWREVEVLGAEGGERGLDLVEQEKPDLVLLDVGLPDIDGYEVLRQIRAFSDVPVVMLTARDDTLDLVKGLELGADDYVTKPFNHLELLARVKAVLRRLDMPAPAAREPSFRSGDLEMDFARQEVRLAGARRGPDADRIQASLPPRPERGLCADPRDAPGQGVGARVRRRGRLPACVRAPAARQARRRPRPAAHIRTERGLGYRFLTPAESVPVDNGA